MSTKKTKETYVSVNEAAEILSRTPTRVRQLIVEKRLPAKRQGWNYSIRRSDLDKLVLRPAGRPAASSEEDDGSRAAAARRAAKSRQPAAPVGRGKAAKATKSS